MGTPWLVLLPLLWVQEPEGTFHTKVFYFLETEGPERALAEVAAKGMTPDDFGRDVLYSGASERALQWYEAMALHTEDAQYLMGRAWTHWYRGEVVKAVRDADYLLTLENLDPTIKARCRYMLGVIGLNGGEIGKAISNLSIAYDQYVILEKKGGQYLALSGLALAEIKAGRLQAAEVTLARAIEASQHYNRPQAGWLNELRAEWHFANQNYKMALHFGEKSAAAYEVEKNAVAGRELRVRVGLLHALNGHLEAAYEIASEMDAVVLERGEVELNHANNLTWILLYRCYGGFDVSEMETKIRQWAEARRHSDLLKQLRFVKEVPCPSGFETWKPAIKIKRQNVVSPPSSNEGADRTAAPRPVSSQG